MYFLSFDRIDSSWILRNGACGSDVLHSEHNNSLGCCYDVMGVLSIACVVHVAGAVHYGGREGRFSISHFAKRIRALRISQSGFAHRALPKVDSLVAFCTSQS